MNWQKSYAATFEAFLVDEETWEDTDAVGITDGTVERDAEKDLIESADLTMDEACGECWIRVYLRAKQAMFTSERVPLFTGLACAPSREIDGSRETYKAECYSVLKPADNVMLERGWYAPTGIPGAVLVKRLLNVCPCPVTYEEDSPELSEAIIAEDGETRLTMAQAILSAINWRLVIDGDGSVNICPYSEEIKETFGADENDSVENAVTDTNDWYGCPNVFRAVSDGKAATYRDETGGKLSIEGRGREIWMEETDVSLADGESLAAYAKRRLTEEQNASRTVEYDRRFFPDIHVSDCIRLQYPSVGLTGIWRVVSQSIALGHSCATSEEAVFVGK